MIQNATVWFDPELLSVTRKNRDTHVGLVMVAFGSRTAAGAQSPVSCTVYVFVMSGPSA
jgi:hypothetical protein